jgi:tRNA (guanine-N7-)-methyltransferase
MGQNLIELAQKNPDKYIVGVDPFMNGVTSVINTSVEKNIKNILLFPYPVQTFFEKFEKIIFEKVFMLFPDPWPKKKHHKRRLFRTEFVKTILKKISKQGKLYFATDNQNYYDEALIALHKENFKEMPIEIKKTDTKELILTKYFLRAKKLGNKVNFLVIVKL